MSAPVLAIDFGTSNSAAAWLDETGRVHVAAIKDGVALLPSVAWYGPTGHCLVGQPARQQMVSDPKNTIFGFKRFLGMSWSSPFVHRHKDRYAFDLAEAPDGTVGVKIADQVKPLEDIAVDIIKRLLELARISAGVNFTEGLITVPAHFGYMQRMSIRRAAVRAGLDVKGMVNEPTAAAMYYARKKGNDGTVLVFDLGGGTFDATLMAIVSGVVKVIATGGDAFLGGADFDARIVEHMLRRFHDDHGIDLRADTAATQRLLIAAEACKVELSRSEEARIRVSAIAMKGERFVDLELRLTRKELEDMTATLVEKCVGSCEDILKRAKIGALEVDEIVFVGGMTRMPMIRRRLADIFVANPTKNVHPDLGVVVGAALLTQGDHSLIDVTSLAIGLSLPGGQNRELVPSNTPVPSVKRVTLSESERPAAGQVLAFGVYEAVDFTSLERDLLGAVRVPADWLAANPGPLAIEAWLGADLDLTMFLHGANGTKLQLPLTVARAKSPTTAPPEEVSKPKQHPGFRSVALEPSPASASPTSPSGTGTARTKSDSVSESGDGSLDDEANAPKPGDVIGGYELIDIIGAGGMGRVYLAEHSKLGRRVALKMLRRKSKKDSTALERFQAEARAVNQIRHENIIEVTDLFETEDGRACYIMEVLEGRSLAELLRGVGVPRLERTVRIAFQIASAMVAVHDAHIIHRDLKPENVFLTARGAREDFVKLLDFGVAKLVDEDGQSIHDTNAGVRIGTLDYMPPEQAVGHAVDHRADIYALGVVLYEMTTGQRPYSGTTDRALLFQQLEKPPPPPSSIMQSKRTIPVELDSLILDCLAREPDKRPQTMREVRGRLEAVAEKLQAPSDAPARSEASAATPVFLQGPNTFGALPTTGESGPNGRPSSSASLAQAMQPMETGEWQPVNLGAAPPRPPAKAVAPPPQFVPASAPLTSALGAPPTPMLATSNPTSAASATSAPLAPTLAPALVPAGGVAARPSLVVAKPGAAPGSASAPTSSTLKKDEDTSKVHRRPVKTGPSTARVAGIVVLTLVVGLGLGWVFFG